MGAQVFNISANRQLAYTNQTPASRRGILFHEFALAYLSKCRKTEKAKKCYRDAFRHFSIFCKMNDLSPMTYEIGMEMLEDFVYYLRATAKLMSSTVFNHLVRLKTLIKMASFSGYDIDYTYTGVNIKVDEHDVVTLDRDEITQLYVYEGLTRSEEIVRDLFVIACMTGLRFSDFSRLKEENFIDNQIQIKTQKTGTLVIIPQSKYVRALLRKYNYQLPKCPCIQHFNKVIKNVCRKAGIITKVPYERTVGLERISEMVEKWKRIGSHSGRRSAATNMFLAGIPALRIMKITGHKTEEAFMHYIGLSKEENAAVLAGNMFFH